MGAMKNKITSSEVDIRQLQGSWFDGNLTIQAIGETGYDILQDEGSLLPAVQDGDILQRVYWPLEMLLVRTFFLPFDDPRFIDAQILSQELAERTGEELDAYWLAWHAAHVDGGVQGLVFGLPKQVREAIKGDQSWANCPQLLVDGWERLSAVQHSDDSCALIDADKDGVFIGYKHGVVWRGLRRLNWNLSQADRLTPEDMARQIGVSWQAMGMDPERDRVYGRVGADLQSVMDAGYGTWMVSCEDILEPRQKSNLAISEDHDSGLNFRHGRWAVQKSVYRFKQWKRPLVMAAMLLLLWLGVSWSEIAELENRAETYSQDIEAAFHAGLPDEKTMLDPLAQLQKAAGLSGSQGVQNSFLHELQMVSQTFGKVPWNLRELSFKNGDMQMSGTVKDLDSLNRMQQLLSQSLAKEVNIADTDLSDGKVMFRMRW